MGRRTAILGLMPARPLRIAESVFRLTPKVLAASVTVTPSGSRQSDLMTPPGAADCTCASRFLSVVILVVDHISIDARKGAREPPVAANSHRPSALPVALQRMQDQPRKRHILRFRCRVQLSQNDSQTFGVLGLYSRLRANDVSARATIGDCYGVISNVPANQRALLRASALSGRLDVIFSPGIAQIRICAGHLRSRSGKEPLPHMPGLECPTDRQRKDGCSHACP